jgi:hypothetical protein
VFTPDLLNAVMTYGSGGYEVQLPTRNASATAAALASLQVDFIDEGTRAVAFGFSLYSPVLDEVTVSQFLVEISPTRCGPSGCADCRVVALQQSLLGVLIVINCQVKSV